MQLIVLLTAGGASHIERRMLQRGVATICFLLAAAITTLAQGSVGSINGTVRDQAGGAIAGATVEVVNTATNERRTTTTSEDGVFNVPQLSVGTYTVTATAAGFATTSVREVNVSVAFATEVPVALGVAGSEIQVEVQAGDTETQLNTTNQQLSTLLDNQKIIDLPTLSRDPNSLILLAPGTVQTTSSLGGFSVNGQRERNNNFLVDGVDNNDTEVPGIAGGLATPSLDATQEFRVITGNFNAEFGRNTGAIVDVATRAGGNRFFGNTYIYYRSDEFSARNFFDRTGNADPLQRKQFGGSLGGPVIFPRFGEGGPVLFRGKDKLFFFANYEGDRFLQAAQQIRSVPSASARQGILNTGSGLFGTLNLSENSANNAFGLPVNPAITRLLNDIFPLGNSPGRGVLPGVFDEYRFTSNLINNTDALATRVDYLVNDSNTATFSFNYNDGTFTFGSETFPGFGDTLITPQTTYVGAIKLTSNITPNVVNDFRFGINRVESIFGGPGDLGISNRVGSAVLRALTASGADTDIPNFGGRNGQLINFGGLGGITGLGNFDTQFRYTGTTTFADSMTFVRGNHTFKGGGEARFIYSNSASNFGRSESLDFSYPTSFGDPILLDNSGNPIPLGGLGGTVQNFASFLYGLVAFQTQSQFFDRGGNRVNQDYRGFRVREYGVYFQDTWRVRPNLTLNYGLRYDVNGVPYEVNGQLSTLVNQDPSGPLPTGGFRFQLVGKNSGSDAKLYQNDFNNFAPRFGFAYSPDFDSGFLAKLTGGPGRTSIRGGYGVFYDRVFGNLFSNARGNPPFQQDAFIIQADLLENVSRVPTQTASPVVQNDAQLFPVIFALPGNNQFQKKFATPYVQQFSFGVQRQLSNTFLIEADYIGSKGTNLLRVIDGQLTSVERVNAIRGTNRTISPTSTFNNYLNGVLNTAFFQTALNVSLGFSTYHSGQFRVTKSFNETAFGSGRVQVAYTLSHSIDNAADPLVGQAGERTFPRDSSGFAGGFSRPERGDSGFDTRHRLVSNFSYGVPFDFENKVLDLLFGDYELTGIVQLQSGNPFSVFGGTDSAGTGLGQRADFANPSAPIGTYTRLAPTQGQDPRTQTGPPRELFRNPCPGTVSSTGACVPGTDGRQGTVPRSAFRGPDFKRVDLALIKNFPFSEGNRRFTVRADVFNIFNRANFGQPVNTINSLNFGQSLTAGLPRTFQFVGRFEF